MPLTLRPYQEAALEALDRYLAEGVDNPCVVLPTGSGKSFVIAEMIRRRIALSQSFRCIVLAHRQELVKQNHDEFKNLVGASVDAGLYCAGLDRRDVHNRVIFAMIQSIFRHADDLPPVDMVVVDEAHHIPISDESDDGMYRRFLKSAREKNPRLRVVGLTATPYRLDVGHVCHKDYVLNEVCYEANVGDLIDEGYLCKLRSKLSNIAPDLKGVSECGGDYNLGELSVRACVSDLVKNTVNDALFRLNVEHRKCCVWFCVDIKHCEIVKRELSARGEIAEMVTSETPGEMRELITGRYRRGEIRHLLNVAVFTEGFNVKQVDAIVLLRPTLSRGLYVQMVGRGLRLHPDKTDCIVLDYAKCIESHGSIDLPEDTYVPMEICCKCGEYFAREKRRCPECGCEVPEELVQRHNACDERKKALRKLHGEIASCCEILTMMYGGVTNRRVINYKAEVEQLLFEAAYNLATKGCEYKVQRNRLLPHTRGEFKMFLIDFFEYARHINKFNLPCSLPDMLRDYFEYEDRHWSEFLRDQRVERQRRREEESRAMDEEIMRLCTTQLSECFY